MRVATLNEDLLFLKFKSPEEAKWVLESGRRNFRGGVLQLERWNPYSGCIRRKGSTQEEWVRVVGLSLNLWKTEILKKIGDACGGFLAIDKITELRMEMKWARILIKSTGSPRPSIVNILEGPRWFELQIWWEVPPWVADVYPVRARVVTKSLKEEEDGAAHAETRVGIVRPSCNDDREKGMAWEFDVGGQAGLFEVERVKLGAAHLLKLRGRDHVGDWVFEKAGSSSLGDGLVQRDAIGPTDRAGFRNGLKGPQLFGPKSDLDRRTKTQKFLGGMKVRKEVQQTGTHTDKACFGQSGPVLIGPNQSESVKSPKAQKQGQRGLGRRKWGLKVASLGPNIDLNCSKVETRCEDEGVRPDEKGSSYSDPLVDPACICAKGPLLDAHEERTGLMECNRFESCGKEGLREMSFDRPLLISSCQGPTENGFPTGQALDLVERGFRVPEEEVAKDHRSRTFGSRYEMVSSSICSSPLCSVFSQPLLYGDLLAWGITTGMRRWGI